MKKSYLLLILGFIVIFLGYFMLNQGFSFEGAEPIIEGEKVVLKTDFNTKESGELILISPTGKEIDSKSINSSYRTTNLKMAEKHSNPLAGKYKLIFRGKSNINKNLSFEKYDISFKEIKINFEKIERGQGVIYDLENTTISLKNGGELPGFGRFIFKIAEMERETDFKESPLGETEYLIKSNQIEGGFMGLAPASYDLNIAFRNDEEVLAQKTKEISLK